MEDFAPNFSYAELSMIKEMAVKNLGEVLRNRGQTMWEFYPKLAEKWDKEGFALKVREPIIPDEKYILATIIYRVDKTDEMIKQELKRSRR